MKKFLSLLFVIVLMFAFASCEDIPEEKLTLYAPDGAPAFAVANILDSGKIGNKETDSRIVSGADPIKVAFAIGEADVAEEVMRMYGYDRINHTLTAWRDAVPSTDATSAIAALPHPARTVLH